MKTIKFTNAQELLAYCKKNNMSAGQVYVDNSPDGVGEHTLLWFFINFSDKINTDISNQHDINGVDYAYSVNWHTDYTGSFELVLPYTQFTKPEVYAVGDTVEVLENATEIGVWTSLTSDKRQAMVGNCYKIVSVYDTVYGIYYKLEYDNSDNFYFPHYCVRKVENPLREMTLEEIEKELGYKVKLIN